MRFCLNSAVEARERLRFAESLQLFPTESTLNHPALKGFCFNEFRDQLSENSSGKTGKGDTASLLGQQQPEILWKEH